MANSNVNQSNASRLHGNLSLSREIGMAKGYSSFQERWRENYTYQIKDRMKVGEDTLGIMSIPDQNYSHKKQVNAWAREGLKRITKPMKCYRYRWFKTNTVWGLGPIFNKGFWQSGEDKETKLSESWSDKDYQVSVYLKWRPRYIT